MSTILRGLLLAAAFASLMQGERKTINGKPDLSGDWRPETAGDTSTNTARTLIEHTGDEIRIREPDGSDKAVTDVKCGVKGKECAARIDSINAKVVLFFNGETLVQLTTKGEDVVKTHRTISEDGQKMTLEVIPLAPPGKTEKVTFVRSDAAGQRTAAAK
jgi:hypothetical protein